TYATLADAPPKGKFSRGDVIVVHDDLFNRSPLLGRATGAKIGTDLSRWTFLNSTQAEVVGVARLPGGNVGFGGKVSPSSGVIAFAITGGSGKFARAHGKVTESESGSTKNATDVYRLILP